MQKKKELSLREYMERFSDEEACITCLKNAKWPDGYICPKCGSNVDGYANCPRCGTPIGVSQPGYASSQPQGNHVKILVFGILSLALAGVVGLIFSFVTLSMSGKYFGSTMV